MGTEQRALRIKELLDLTQFGIEHNNIASNVTMESDRYICLREGPSERPALVFIELSKPIKRSFTVYYGSVWDYLIVNPVSRVVARRIGRRLRILKLDSDTTRESEMKAHTMQDDVIFWKWINNRTIGVVTETAVYHWAIRGDSEPVKIFNTQVFGPIVQGLRRIKEDLRRSTSFIGPAMDYITDHSLRCVALIDLLGSSCMEFYSVNSEVSRTYPSNKCAFTKFKLEHNSEPSILFCYVSYSETPYYTIHITEVGKPAEGDRPYREKVLHVCHPETRPYWVYISQKLNIIYIINFPGTVDLYDVESGNWIYSQPISIGAPLLVVPHSATSGLVLVHSFCKVLTISIDEEKIIHHITTTLKKPELARRLASRWNVTGPSEIP